MLFNFLCCEGALNDEDPDQLPSELSICRKLRGARELCLCRCRYLTNPIGGYQKRACVVFKTGADTHFVSDKHVGEQLLKNLRELLWQLRHWIAPLGLNRCFSHRHSWSTCRNSNSPRR